MASFISYASQTQVNISYNQFVEVLSNADDTVNELSARSGKDALNRDLNSVFQSLSENKLLVAIEPQERVQRKTELLQQCFRSMENCNYVPEGYAISIHRNFLSIKYQYNAFSSYDEYYKYAVVDLSAAERLTWSGIFIAPEDILERYNSKYVKENEDYLNRFDPGELDEDQEWEFEVIRDHLDNRLPFKLDSLNNLELIFDETETLNAIRFHYNGSGGPYKSVLSEGYIAFDISEIEHLLTQDFKALLNPPTPPQP